MNKNELVRLRNGWLNEASRDLSSRINEFIRQSGMNEQQLADVLALDVNQVRNMLRGATNVTLLEFATLLIATGMVLRIEPVAASPFAQQPNTPQRRAAAPSRSRGPQRDSNGRFVRGGAPVPPPMGAMPMPPMGGMMPPMGAVPPMPMSGIPMPPYPEAPMAAQAEAVNFDAMKRKDLVDMVKNNHWDGEIDLDEADRSQIIAFLESKNQPQQTIEQQPMAPAPQMPKDSNVSQMAQMIIEQMANNPQMMQQLASMMPQQN